MNPDKDKSCLPPSLGDLRPAPGLEFTTRFFNEIRPTILDIADVDNLSLEILCALMKSLRLSSGTVFRNTGNSSDKTFQMVDWLMMEEDKGVWGPVSMRGQFSVAEDYRDLDPEDRRYYKKIFMAELMVFSPDDKMGNKLIIPLKGRDRIVRLVFCLDEPEQEMDLRPYRDDLEAIFAFLECAYNLRAYVGGMMAKVSAQKP